MKPCLLRMVSSMQPPGRTRGQHGPHKCLPLKTTLQLKVPTRALLPFSTSQPSPKSRSHACPTQLPLSLGLSPSLAS